MRRVAGIVRCLLVAALLVVGAARCAEDEKPKHLVLAEEIVKEIKPEKNLYTHKNIFITWKDGKDGAYENHSDCSGFLNLLFGKAYGYSREDYFAWTGRARPVAKVWYETIKDGKGFKPIATAQEIRPGDVLAIKYEPGGENTGHILIAAGAAREKDAKKPVVEDTRQWELPVIDSSKSPHGPKDTRKADDGTSGTGVGAGVLRLYTDEKGVPAGYAWSFFANSEFRAVKDRPIAVGRLIPGYKPPAPKDGQKPHEAKTDENEGD